MSSQAQADGNSSSAEPKIVGLYGVSGCGKSTLLAQLIAALDPTKFELYEGTTTLLQVCSKSLAQFKALSATEKDEYRVLAIRKIHQECAQSGKIGVVTGHFLLWSEGDAKPDPIWTEQGDAQSYTHVIYLDVDPSAIRAQRDNDQERERPKVSVDHLTVWQKAEKMDLRKICYRRGILFTAISKSRSTSADPNTSDTALLDKVVDLLQDFRVQNPDHNMELAIEKLDEIMSFDQNKDAQTILLIDGDKTLTDSDTGELFWHFEKQLQSSLDNKSPLRALFTSQPQVSQYLYITFRQAQLMYNQVDRHDSFLKTCDRVAGSVDVYPEFATLLHDMETNGKVGIIVVTCGLRRVWEKILELQPDTSGSVEVIGAGTISGEKESDRFVVTPEVKEALVTRLQKEHKKSVWAFGDSPIDIPMLHKADRAVVVSGPEVTRSKSMDTELQRAVDEHGLVACQVLPIPVGRETSPKQPPRLTERQLPVMSIPDLYEHHIKTNPRGRLIFRHATNRPGSRILARDTRDARIAGPRLREAHRRIGQYLALEFVAAHIGCEKVSIPGVQGKAVIAHQLLHEERTLILPLMRGGEPMAMGVNDAFPLASVLHAKGDVDITKEHVTGRSTIILVDSVVNTGRSLLTFIRRIRGYHSSIRIVVVAGVVQEKTVEGDSFLRKGLAEYGTVTMFALRMSENQFKGQGGTDTGNRLFNTVYLDEKRHEG